MDEMLSVKYEEASLEEVLAGAGAVDSRLVGITTREMQVLRWIVAGKTNKQMARMLSRSQRTVEYHRNRLMRKLNAHNAAELVQQVFAMGIL